MLWRLLELVSEPSSIDYRVLPGRRRDKVLHAGSGAAGGRRSWPLRRPALASRSELVERSLSASAAARRGPSEANRPGAGSEGRRGRPAHRSAARVGSLRPRQPGSAASPTGSRWWPAATPRSWPLPLALARWHHPRTCRRSSWRLPTAPSRARGWAGCRPGSARVGNPIQRPVPCARGRGRAGRRPPPDDRVQPSSSSMYRGFLCWMVAARPVSRCS